AEACGFGVCLPGSPGYDSFVEPAFTGQAVDPLSLFRAAGNGSLQPAPPRFGLFEIARVHQGEQRECRVSQPAEAVVPVAIAAKPLGQRSRSSGGNASRTGV